MIDRAATAPRCLGFAAFLESRPAKLDYWLNPLREDVKRMAADAIPFQRRLSTVQHTLIDMLNFLDPECSRFPARSRTKV